MGTVAQQKEIDRLELLPTVRERADIVYKAAGEGKLKYFDLDNTHMPEVVEYVLETIKETFGPDKYNEIPTHGRWNHFEYDGVFRVRELMKNWSADDATVEEQARRIIDLIFVSVLLDAGVPSSWKYIDTKGREHRRSEGLAVASLDMYLSGTFSKGNKNKFAITCDSLQNLTTESLKIGLQITPENSIVAIEARVLLLQRFGASIGKVSISNRLVFGNDKRPGNMIDFPADGVTPKQRSVEWLWQILQKVLLPIWASRHALGGKALGDAWPLSILAEESGSKNEADSFQPFHKLTQWLAYSLMAPFERCIGVSWSKKDLLTGLPEYRNGGLFFDMGVLMLKATVLNRGLERTKKEGNVSGLPTFDVGEEVVVEWRAMTVALLDELHRMLLKEHERFYENEDGSVGSFKINMGQLLEAGSWKAGRKIAKEKRPETGSGPFIIISDGTVF